MSLHIHWAEGLFLQPHHLQRAQHSVADQIRAERQLSWPYPYGVLEAKLSRDELENMRVRFDRLRVIMPSGLEVNFPENADLPTLDIRQAFSKGTGSFGIALGVPLWQPGRANTFPLGQPVDPRVKLLYRVGEVECADENTGENAKPLQVRKINARLMLEQEDTSDMEALPLLRIVRATGEEVGLPREDSEYVPPCLILSGSPVLREMVRDLAWPELRRFDVGAWFDTRFKGEIVPGLDEVFGLVGRRAEIHVEVKAGSGRYPGIEGRLVEFLRRRKALKSCVVSSFDLKALFVLRGLEPRLRLGYLLGPTPLEAAWQEMEELRAESLNLGIKQVTSARVAAGHRRRHKILVYTVNDARQARRLKDMGVDGIFSNFPRLLEKDA